jgi:predicted O-methyltransferase YrrM
VATAYVLGSSEEEIARLDAQAESLASPTALLLGAAGIAPGMRVLEIGTGLGHVALQLAQHVGPSGSVVAVDQNMTMLSVAEARRRTAGVKNVRFAESDARTFRDREPFDALVTRLLLFHLPDAVDVVRHHVAGLHHGGLAVVLDFDIGTARSEPDLPRLAEAASWIETAFRAAGADPRVGTRLARILEDAGLTGVTSFGVQRYLRAGDREGPAQIADVVRSLARPIVAAGLATEEEIAALPNLLAEEVAAAEAVILPPGLVGAWGTRP